MKAGLRTIKGTNALGQEENRLYVESEVVSLGTKVLELNNAKKTQYRLATVAYVAKDGTIKQATAQVWEVNVPKVKVGSEHLTEVRKIDGRDGNPVIMLTLTALSVAERASIDDFDFSEVEADASTIGA